MLKIACVAVWLRLERYHFSRRSIYIILLCDRVAMHRPMPVCRFVSLQLPNIIRNVSIPHLLSVMHRERSLNATCDFKHSGAEKARPAKAESHNRLRLVRRYLFFCCCFSCFILYCTRELCKQTESEKITGRIFFHLVG